MRNGSASVNPVVFDHPFFLYQTRTGILTGNTSSVRSEALAVSHGKGVTKGHVSHRKHPQFHEHLRVQ